MSETQMAEIKRFLMARYAEDEAAAKATLGDYAGHKPSWTVAGSGVVFLGDDDALDDVLTDGPVAQHIARHDPARVLADCHVNRSFVEFATSAGAPWSPLPKGSPVGLNLLAILAEPFADHPDYRQEWKP